MGSDNTRVKGEMTCWSNETYVLTSVFWSVQYCVLLSWTCSLTKHSRSLVLIGPNDCVVVHPHFLAGTLSTYWLESWTTGKFWLRLSWCPLEVSDCLDSFSSVTRSRLVRFPGHINVINMISVSQGFSLSRLPGDETLWYIVTTAKPCQKLAWKINAVCQILLEVHNKL
jgi:hypothetical protein